MFRKLRLAIGLALILPGNILRAHGALIGLIVAVLAIDFFLAYGVVSFYQNEVR